MSWAIRLTLNKIILCWKLLFLTLSLMIYFFKIKTAMFWKWTCLCIWVEMIWRNYVTEPLSIVNLICNVGFLEFLYTPPYSAKFKNACSCRSCLPCGFMACTGTAVSLKCTNCISNCCTEIIRNSTEILVYLQMQVEYARDWHNSWCEQEIVWALYCQLLPITIWMQTKTISQTESMPLSVTWTLEQSRPM